MVYVKTMISIAERCQNWVMHGPIFNGSYFTFDEEGRMGSLIPQTVVLQCSASEA